MTDENATHNAQAEAARGDEALAAAKHLSNGAFHSDAVSRAYYAAFHWARALLISRGLEPRTHRGVIQLLSLHFAKSGELAPETASLLGQLETLRELGDDAAAASFSAAEAEDAITVAGRFVDACRPLLPPPCPDPPGDV